jgi:hypothetical protein
VYTLENIFHISHINDHITVAFNHIHPLLASTTSDPHCSPTITIFTFHPHHPLSPPEPPRSSALTIFTSGPFFHRHYPLPPPEPPRSSAVSPPSLVFSIWHSNFRHSVFHTSLQHRFGTLLQSLLLVFLQHPLSVVLPSYQHRSLLKNDICICICISCDADSENTITRFETP